MELCVMIEGQEGVSWRQWCEIAAACEQHGIPALFRSDHYLPLDGHAEWQALDAWGTVCALAATTESLRIGTLVSPVTFRPPAVLAKLAATADRISGGRIEVGMGAGWHAGEHRAFGLPFPETPERLALLAEQLEIVRGLWSDERFSFAGEHYELPAVDARPKPVQAPLPLIVGGSGGVRSTSLAARFGAEYNTPFPTLEQVRKRQASFARAWRAAGEDPDTMRFSVMTGFVAGRDAEGATRRVRRVGDLRGEADFEPPESWIRGGRREAAMQLRALSAAGVDRVMLQLLAHDDLDQIELIGSDLAAALLAPAD